MKGALSAAFSTWLGLIALHAVAQRGASGRIGELFNDVNSIVERVLDADVPAIPDRRNPTTTTVTRGGGGGGIAPALTQ